MQCSAIILAGGRGRRVGGADKGLIQTGDEGSLVQQVIERLVDQVDDITISANRNLDQYRRTGYPVIVDALPEYQGPLAGVQAALPHCQKQLVVVVGCDTPRLPLDLASRLLAPLLADSAIEACYAHDGSREQYLCCAIRRQLKDGLDSYLAQGRRSVRGWLAQHAAHVVDFSDCADAFSNLNTVSGN